jgi:hypothetical protein
VEWSSLFYYDETSPSCLRWNTDRFNGCYRNVKVICKGDVAGRFNSTLNYFLVDVCKVRYRCHRIIWEIHNGPIPDGMVIDHINQNTKDNKIQNLRCVSKEINRRNMKKSKRNSSGVVGVFRAEKESCGRVYAYWVVRWSPLNSDENGIKQFSVLKYGEEKAKYLAIEFRELMIKKLNSQGAGYTELHGSERAN